MNVQALLCRPGQAPVRAGLVGVGQFGMTLLAQSRRIADLSLEVLCDREVERVVAACIGHGVDREDVVIASGRPSVLAALERGKVVVTDDSAVATSLGLEVIVEATGDLEAGAATAVRAIDDGAHLVLVTKETDAVVGPVLARRARAAGLTLTQVDGDQPSLVLGLIAWARTLGLEVIAAGKASEHDFVADLAGGVVTADGRPCPAPDLDALWAAAPDHLAQQLARRAEAFATLPQRSVADFCELCLVANGSCLVPDRPDLHAVVARPVELADIFRLASNGGLLGGSGRLEVFNCLRRPDEISFAGGVFATVALPDQATGRLFAAKGIPVSTDHQSALIYNPTHLLGVEAPLSILSAARLGMATGSDTIRPVCDLVARASRDLPAGTLLSEGRRHAIDGVEPNLIAAAPAREGAPIPYLMAANRRLRQPVAAGRLIPFEAVEPPAESLVWSLRAEQDRTLL